MRLSGCDGVGIMSRMQREKGKRGEREVAQLLRDHGYPGRRTSQYAGMTGDSSDVVGLDGYHIEVKRQEKTHIHEWIAQSERDAGTDIALVVHRRSGDPWYVTLRFEEFLEVIK